MTWSTLEAVYDSLAPLWVELSFLFFFSMGFFYLRAENFRKGKGAKMEPQFRASAPYRYHCSNFQGLV